jgi:uncharacterized protein YqfB (UPF0267 family)
MKKILLILNIFLVIALIFMTYKYVSTYSALEKSVLEMTALVERLDKIENKYNRNMDNVEIEVLEDSITPSQATIIIRDNNQNPYMWDENYKIEKKENNLWIDVNTIAEVKYDEKELKIENKQAEQKVIWKDKYGELSQGTYRIVKYVYTSVEDIFFESNEFEIK